MNVQTDKQPHFTHDYDLDVYLGTYFFPFQGKTVWDLYYTPRPGRGGLCVAARCGNAPSDIRMVNVERLKGLEQANSEQILLCEAYRRAREKHYLA